MKPLIGIGVVLGLILLWWFWPQKDKISDSEYEVAIALYRVCNQANDEGLARIETLIADAEGAEPDKEVSPLRSIVEMAKLGQWKDAARACREIMDNQVSMLITPMT
ncbi:hypothetical protein LF1_28750 [Rubripirellula obstinata]|uniref:Tetratricopeptide repeat protein n=1 Tax=Rubripirellula obstinata TaxID=406547 RepID=A0A5B1CID9_9BACT|nr:hypothetical protein [Rubripirellula obstinata]KAA1260336.1 hypothetical protein LF1_28750 [Rubripirellula obstinata]